jgi:predicted 3-demethylubiquinone-9 3-methyltransferase (glyoxalase superfamily)
LPRQGDGEILSKFLSIRRTSVRRVCNSLRHGPMAAARSGSRTRRVLMTVSAHAITPCLWFDNRIEEAVNFYISVFGQGEVLSKSHYGEGAPQPKGTVLVMTFRLGAQKFMALNGGPIFKFNEAVSFMVNCDTQAEVDHFWNAFTADGGQESQCGWLKDKYGLSWQIVPNVLPKIMGDKDPAKASRAMAAMMKMKKLDIAALEKAQAG